MSDALSLPSRPMSPVSEVPEIVNPQRAYRFTWDSAARRAGPESVSGATEGRGNNFNYSRPPLGFLTTSSSSLAPGALPTEWSSSRHGFHAISTVLNNPYKSQAPPKAHSALPIVPPADLPRVRRKDFDSYLRAIAPEWDRFQRNAKLGKEGQAHIDTGPLAPRTSISSDAPSKSLTQLPVLNKSISPLDSVPAVFFEPKFDLGNPHTFNSVAEGETESTSSLNDDSNGPLSLSYSPQLLDKFSQYADTVEQHLIREISLRSTSFFAALSNLNELQSESEQCLDRIGRLRTMLRDVGDNGAKKGLEMVRKECKMDRLDRVRESIKMLSGIVEMTGVARGLVSARQWGEALEVIEALQKMWDFEGLPDASIPAGSDAVVSCGNGHRIGKLSPLPATLEEQETDDNAEAPIIPSPRIPQPTIPLSSLKAFEALPTHLLALTMEIATSLANEHVAILRDDLRKWIDNDSACQNGSTNQYLKDRLSPHVQNLVRTKGLKKSLLSWREVVLDEVQEIVKKRLPESESIGAESKIIQSSSTSDSRDLGTLLRSMSQADFMSLIQSFYKQLFDGISRLQTQSEIHAQILLAMSSQSWTSSTEIPQLEEELADILSSAAELANTQAAKVIAYRTEQHSLLGLAEFVAFFNDSWSFVVKCEVVCRRMIVGLRGTVVGQAKSFLQQFHQARLTKSAKLVEDEQWSPSEVNPTLQKSVDIVMECAISDPRDLVILPDNALLSQPPAHAIAPSASNGPSSSRPSSPVVMQDASLLKSKEETADSPSGRTKHLLLDGRSFYVVNATSEMLLLLMDYLKVIVNLTMLTTETMGRLIEFLKSFNSRTCQVVLGAGAMRSAGLKNITARHLALASQSLSVVSFLIPYVREMFRRHLSPKQAVMLVEFDKLKRDYQEHQNEIHAKLIAIMGDRLNTHARTLQGIDWSVPKPDGGVNGYMEVLVKETVTLHKVLSRYLALPVVEYVMTQVFAAINHRLSEEYGSIKLPHQEAKTRLLADAKYLHQQLSALKNVTAPTGMLETVIAEKSIPHANPPTPPLGNTISNANQRLKGLLSGKVSQDTEHPPSSRVPTRSPSPHAEALPEKIPSMMSAPPISQSLNGGLSMSMTDVSLSDSNLVVSMSPSLQDLSVLAEDARIAVAAGDPEPGKEL